MSEEMSQEQAAPVVDYKQENEQLKQELEKLKSKHQEFLQETKKAKTEVAKAKQDSQTTIEQLQAQLNELVETSRKDRALVKERSIKVQATKMAMELANGDDVKANLLSSFIEKSLESESNDLGEVEDGVLTNLKKSFKNNPAFAPLIIATKASGGGAIGNSSKGSAQKDKVLTRDEFEQIPFPERMTFIKSGGKVIDSH